MKQEINLNGIWHNQYGSELKLEVDDTGRVTGKFRTAIGRNETKGDWQGAWFEVLGFVNKGIISFVVNLDTSNAMYVVTGRISLSEQEGKVVKKIHTFSYTNFNLPQEDQWKSIVADSVVYEEGAAPI